MTDENVWRLQGQERYLHGARLVHRAYRQYEKNLDWDHDHCQFCGAKFVLGSHEEALQVGYATLDEYHWICESCFRDFHERFEWTVVEASENDAGPLR